VITGMLNNIDTILPPFLDKILPRMAAPLAVAFLTKMARSLDRSQISILDADLDALIDGIGARDYEAVGALVEKYNIQENSRAGILIMRLMGEKESQNALVDYD